MGSSGHNPPAVGVFLDDLYLGKTGFSDLDFFDLKHVEVRRGPQSTLYGRRTQAGAVKLVSREPAPEWEARIFQDMGNYHPLQTRLNVSGPVSGDKLSMGIAGSHRERDGFTRNDFLQEEVDTVDQNAVYVFPKSDPLAQLGEPRVWGVNFTYFS